MNTLIAAEALTLPELVYQQLRKAILDGVFAPGQALNQVDVANRLGVSRSPLREALPRLEAEGIVVSNPRKGYTVAAHDPDEVEEAFDLRRLLETELAVRAVRLRESADIAKVFQVLAELETAQPEVGAENSKWFELNTRFHKALLEPAGRPHFMRALDNSCVPMEAHIRAEVRITGDVVQAQAEHTELAQAFAAGDSDRFVGLIQAHTEHTKHRLLAGLARGGS